MGLIRGTLVGDLEALAALEPDWWALWRRCPAATPFQTPAWLLSWWRTFTPGRLATAAVWADGALVGLALFYIEPGSGRLLPVGIGISDHLDLLVDPAQGPEAGAALLTVLDEAGGWDMLSMEELPPCAAGLSLRARAAWSDDLREQSACPVLNLRAGEGDIPPIPSAKRRKLRMARHRAARRETRIERADARSAPAHLRALFELHQARWESRGEAGVLADPRVRALHEAALPGLVAHDLLRAYVVHMDGALAGAFYGFRSRDIVFAYLGGFDPAFAFESPGTLLLGAAIEDACREGVAAFSFLRGREPYKYEWGAVDRMNLCRTFRRSAAR